MNEGILLQSASLATAIPQAASPDTTPKESILGMLGSTTLHFQSQPPLRSGMNHTAHHRHRERLLPGHHLWGGFACQSIFGSSPAAPPLYIL